jgi:hypothetical protein
MHLTFRLRTLFLLFGAVLVLAACSTPAPAPIAISTPAPTLSPTPEPTMTPNPNPLIPNFGAFPPLSIPARPANINPLTGLAADPASLERRPILVRIGNDERVRTSLWQAGMTSADLVFEELIDQIGSTYINTRMTAVFLSHAPQLVGPVRSGRLVNLQLAPMFDGALANAGASDGVRLIFSKTPMVNLDEYFNQPAYCYNLPHGYMGRLYTTVPRLQQWLTEKGLEKPVPLYGFEFSAAPPAGPRVDSIGIQDPPWPKWAAVEWNYDPDTQKYLRSVTGSPHIDNSYEINAKWGNAADCVPAGAATHTRVTASNVVVLYAEHDQTNIVEDSNNAMSVYINLIGHGDAAIFRDGVAVRGHWQRHSVQEFFEFVDDTGKLIPLKPGTTWFEIVPLGYKLKL